MRVISSVGWRRRWLLAAAIAVGVAAVAWADDGSAAGTDLTARMTSLTLQLAAIFGAAKLAGHACTRWLHVPAVLGELLAGVAIGPYALGPHLGLFPTPAPGAFPLTPELYGIATLGSLLLLYLTGLETDLAMFLRYSLVGSLVGVGGVVVSFAVGDLAAVWFGVATHWADPAALFLGTIATATSVGITARILEERRQLQSAEGVTVLAGAVIDDVLGIVILAVVIGYATMAQGAVGMQWSAVLGVAAKALGFWLASMLVGILLAPRLGRALTALRSGETMAMLSLGLALLLAGLAEKAGLAMIVGAYVMGVSLSRSGVGPELKRHLEPVYAALISVFFCAMGMLVDLHAVHGVLIFGLIYTALAMVAKYVGCGLPAWLTRFNARGASRVGVAMMPRGEVALIVAGIGLASGTVGSNVFGVAILMTLLTTLVSPLLIVHLFGPESGVRPRYAQPTAPQREFHLDMTHREVAAILVTLLIELFEREGCYVRQLTPGEPTWQVTQETMAITVQQVDAELRLSCSEPDSEFARLALTEACALLVRTVNQVQREQLASQVRQVLR